MPRELPSRILPVSITAAAGLWAAAFACRPGERVLIGLAITASVMVFVILAMRYIVRRLTAVIDDRLADMGRTVDQHCRDLNASMRHIVWADQEDRRRREDAALRDWSGG